MYSSYGSTVETGYSQQREKNCHDMAIRVECYAGYRGEQEPLAFWLGGRRLVVCGIVDWWFAQGSAGSRSTPMTDRCTSFDTMKRPETGNLPPSPAVPANVAPGGL